MRLIITEFSPVSCHFLPLSPKYLPQQPTLYVTDQVSHPYRTAGQIVNVSDESTTVNVELEGILKEACVMFHGGRLKHTHVGGTRGCQWAMTHPLVRLLATTAAKFS